MTQQSDESRDRLTDVLDIAAENEGAFRDNAIREARAKVKQTQSPDSEGVYEINECVECDLEIGEGRLRLAPKNTLCFFCATAAERIRR